ncbi:MAG TPA: carboxypeptidase regulatory-like domain-containing protein, partial [Vicinamibacterales bacterium]|nr:carboxypeptidase regulatory-like domain-containing protein [Vicinamibacterales bacterium]
MRFRWWVLTLVSLALLVVAQPTLAQEQSGSIEGVVKDSSGGVLPGVMVEARSPAVVGVSTTVSNAQGIYRFPALPPGVYTVTATLEGFTPQRSEAVLALGQLLKIDLTMAVGGLSETVEVTGESPLIDVKQNASFATVSKEIIEKIPRGRDFTSVVSQAPGTNQEAYAGGIQVDGASGSENRFVVDGMDTTAMRSGTSNKTVPLDFIQEVQVKSSGYNAEFGGATGGVISAISKAGSNAMHGGGGMYFDSNKLRGAMRPTWRINPFTDAGGNFPGVKEEVYTADYPWKRYDPVLDLGGPLVKDKLWYWVGYSANRTNNERTTKFYYSPTKDYTRTFQWHDQDNYLNWNLNTQVGNNVRFKLNGATTWSRNRGTAPALQPNGSTFVDGSPTDGFTTATYPSTTAWPGDIDEYMDLMYGKTGSDYTNNLFSGSMDWVITPTFFVNVTAGSLTYDTFQPTELAGDRAIRNFASSNMTYLPGVIPDNLRYASSYADWPKSTSRTEKAYYSRLFLNANATVFKSFHGQHTMKFGARYERLSTDLLQGAQYPTLT